MRIALISDVHANLHALRPALRAVERLGADLLVCAGDLVGYGPNPNECVEAIAEREIPCAAGNHDLIAIGRLSDERCAPLARASQHWTQQVLKPDTRAHLEGLPPRLVIDDLVIAHGDLDDPQTYVTSETQAAVQLEQLQREHPQARTLVLGHTHRRWIYAEAAGAVVERDTVRLDSGRRYLLNPGAIGQSRQMEARPRARLMVLDTRTWEVACPVVGYDDAGCRAELRRLGLPRESIHTWPGKAPRHARSAKRRLRKALGLGQERLA